MRVGVNLPAQVPERRRTYFTSLHIEPSQDRIGIGARALVRDVEAHGYHLLHSGVPDAEWQRDTSAEGRNGLMRPDRICRAGTVNYELNRGGL